MSYKGKVQVLNKTTPAYATHVGRFIILESVCNVVISYGIDHIQICYIQIWNIQPQSPNTFFILR